MNKSVESMQEFQTYFKSKLSSLEELQRRDNIQYRNLADKIDKIEYQAVEMQTQVKKTKGQSSNMEMRQAVQEIMNQYSSEQTKSQEKYQILFDEIVNLGKQLQDSQSQIQNVKNNQDFLFKQIDQKLAQKEDFAHNIQQQLESNFQNELSIQKTVENFKNDVQMSQMETQQKLDQRLNEFTSKLRSDFESSLFQINQNIQQWQQYAEVITKLQDKFLKFQQQKRHGQKENVNAMESLQSQLKEVYEAIKLETEVRSKLENTLTGFVLDQIKEIKSNFEGFKNKQIQISDRTTSAIKKEFEGRVQTENSVRIQLIEMKESIEQNTKQTKEMMNTFQEDFNKNQVAKLNESINLKFEHIQQQQVLFQQALKEQTAKYEMDFAKQMKDLELNVSQLQIRTENIKQPLQDQINGMKSTIQFFNQNLDSQINRVNEELQKRLEIENKKNISDINSSVQGLLMQLKQDIGVITDGKMKQQAEEILFQVKSQLQDVQLQLKQNTLSQVKEQNQKQDDQMNQVKTRLNEIQEQQQTQFSQLQNNINQEVTNLTSLNQKQELNIEKLRQAMEAQIFDKFSKANQNQFDLIKQFQNENISGQLDKQVEKHQKFIEDFKESLEKIKLLQAQQKIENKSIKNSILEEVTLDIKKVQSTMQEIQQINDKLNSQNKNINKRIDEIVGQVADQGTLSAKMKASMKEYETLDQEIVNIKNLSSQKIQELDLQANKLKSIQEDQLSTLQKQTLQMSELLQKTGQTEKVDNKFLEQSIKNLKAQNEKYSELINVKILPQLENMKHEFTTVQMNLKQMKENSEESKTQVQNIDYKIETNLSKLNLQLQKIKNDFKNINEQSQEVEKVNQKQNKKLQNQLEDSMTQLSRQINKMQHENFQFSPQKNTQIMMNDGEDQSQKKQEIQKQQKIINQLQEDFQELQTNMKQIKKNMKEMKELNENLTEQQELQQKATKRLQQQISLGFDNQTAGGNEKSIKHVSQMQNLDFDIDTDQSFVQVKKQVNKLKQEINDIKEAMEELKLIEKKMKRGQDQSGFSGSINEEIEDLKRSNQQFNRRVNQIVQDLEEVREEFQTQGGYSNQKKSVKFSDNLSQDKPGLAVNKQIAKQAVKIEELEQQQVKMIKNIKDLQKNFDLLQNDFKELIETEATETLTSQQKQNQNQKQIQQQSQPKLFDQKVKIPKQLSPSQFKAGKVEDVKGKNFPSIKQQDNSQETSEIASEDESWTQSNQPQAQNKGQSAKSQNQQLQQTGQKQLDMSQNQKSQQQNQGNPKQLQQQSQNQKLESNSPQKKNELSKQEQVQPKLENKQQQQTNKSNQQQQQNQKQNGPSKSIESSEEDEEDEEDDEDEEDEDEDEEDEDEELSSQKNEKGEHVGQQKQNKVQNSQKKQNQPQSSQQSQSEALSSQTNQDEESDQEEDDNSESDALSEENSSEEDQKSIGESDEMEDSEDFQESNPMSSKQQKVQPSQPQQVKQNKNLNAKNNAPQKGKKKEDEFDNAEFEMD